MGISNTKLPNKNTTIDCKKEYFKIMRKDFTEGVKQINSTIHSKEKDNNSNNDNWINFLLEKFSDYLKNNLIVDKYINDILFYLNNTEEISEAKYVYNLTIFLAKDITEINSKGRKQSFMERYCTEEEYNNTSSKFILSLNKDEMLWRSCEYIMHQLEEISHPINAFLNHLTFILATVYEKEYQNVLNIGNNLENLKGNEKLFPLSEEYSSLDANAETADTFFTHDRESSIKNTSQIENFYKAIHKEIDAFSNFATGALIRFYSIKNTTAPKLFEIFSEKVRDIIVRKDLYRLIYQIKSKLREKKKENFSQSLIELYNIKPHYLYINPYFAMDKEFKNYIKSILLKSAEEKKYNQVNSNRKETYKTNISKIPYTNSIQFLRKLSEADSILKKIDLMYKLRSSIFNEIDEFWKSIPIKRKYKFVDADNLLSIFIYLVIKSQMNSLIIDIEIIDDFTNRSMKLSRRGYFFSLFQSSIEYLISNITFDQLESNINEYNQMITKEINLLQSVPENVIDMQK
jgi:hypothetical protein